MLSVNEFKSEPCSLLQEVCGSNTPQHVRGDVTAAAAAADVRSALELVSSARANFLLILSLLPVCCHEHCSLSFFSWPRAHGMRMACH